MCRILNEPTIPISYRFLMSQFGSLQLKIVTFKITIMKVSTKLRYSARLLLALGEKGEILSTSELGRRLGVSPLYLRPIAVKLEKEGIIESFRGAKGGYKLAKEPAEITMLFLAQLYENLNIVPCVEEPQTCPFSTRCKARRLWIKLKNCIEEFLEKVTIEDIINETP